MFDLSKSDLLHPGDVVVTFAVGDTLTRDTVLATLIEKGYDQWAFSDRGDHLQYLMITNREERSKQISPGGFTVPLGDITNDTLASLAR